MNTFDVIIIGSGPAGVSAAWPLVKSNKKVLMLDVGFDTKNPKKIKTKKDSSPKVSAKEFSYVFRDFNEFYKIKTKNFSANGSLAKGGLSNAWSALTSAFSDEEFSSYPFSREKLLTHYISIGKRIGISGIKAGSLTPWIGNEYVTQPSLPIHPLTQLLLNKYESSKLKSKDFEFKLGMHNQAILSKQLNERMPFDQKNISGFKDLGDSVYNSADELKNLMKNKNFNYLSDYFVNEVFEEENKTIVKALNIKNGRKKKFHSKFLILAAGTLGSTKLAIKATNSYNKYFKIQNTPMFPFILLFPFQINRSKKISAFSFWHLSYYLQLNELKANQRIFGHLMPTDGISSQELIKRIKLPRHISSIIGNFIWPKLLLGACVFPGIFSNNRMILKSNDELDIIGDVSDDLDILIKKTKSILTKIFRKFGAYLFVQNINITPGEDFHLACTLPMKKNPKLMETDQNGCLYGKEKIYIVDGSVLSYLPAKSHTFTIMANSERISKVILRRL